ncbi:hypothetical protein SKAU_G00298410 [Synaphobranchus kaupii]|uniref:Coiled-coil domain-containing protein 103 n=1 Tax=Synaphobranchus kaupii TaxID=118154 RepID=A0A9Q1EV77_SYNKA|nr:hypothetical protein SKAU_G00298410 [Synaphobranchus kaupii]
MHPGMEDSEVINFSALEKELQAALEADKKYRRENDAKFRAIHQNVGSYEEFRDIVLASHLQPLERKDKTGGPRKQPWNPIASGTGKPSTAHCDTMEASEFRPRTAAEFSRDWRRFEGNAADRYQLLVSLGGEGVRRLFGAEVGSGLLGDFLLVLCECLRPADAADVAGVLDGMSRTGRFGLNVSFLSRDERGACLRLITRLLEIARSGDPGTDAGQNAEPRGAEGNAVRDSETTRGENILEKLKSLTQLYGVHVDSPKK